ncbi:ABC transporter ATP-binding protein [Diplocloster hominis]|uniref:ABC transporter ATP-binding protein n=1 Tax=Diplocloster hominis TaxID=3079010 RepID=UPI0031B9B65F
MIEVKNLVKRYGGHTAVNDLSFEVEEGQIYGFLGPNGAGKSTTMNIITGYLAPSEGQVLINGHDIFEEPEEAKKCIGYLPEQPPLYMDMTPFEYLNFCVELKGVEKEKRQDMIREIMGRTKILDVKDRLIRNLSKGYRQRVGLAQALIGYPPVIILDEPTVGLDPKQIIEIRDLIKDLGKHHTVILSSHILSEVSAVCDYVMIISRGELVASDTPDNLSKLVLGSNVLELTVKGTKQKVEQILKRMEQIREFEIHSSNTPDCVAVTIKTNEKVDLREDLSYEFAGERCPILEMKQSNMSLEDVFLELTAERPKAESDKEKRSFFRRRKKKVELTVAEEVEREISGNENTGSESQSGTIENESDETQDNRTPEEKEILEEKETPDDNKTESGGAESGQKQEVEK